MERSVDEVIGGATSWVTVVNVYLGINKSAAEFLTSFGSWVNDIRSQFKDIKD